MIIGFGPVAMVVYLAMVLFTQMKERRQLRELQELDDLKPWWHVPEDSLLSKFLIVLRVVLECTFRLGIDRMLCSGCCLSGLWSRAHIYCDGMLHYALRFCSGRS